MKKIKISLIIIIMFLFIININKINAAEELPDDGAEISSTVVTQVRTGTGPFDENDDSGNDSSENNNIVRSFDQVTWTVENTMVLKNSSVSSYSGGRIYFEATLPDVFNSQTAHWDLESMGWIEDANVSGDGLTITGYYQMNVDNVTIPGKQNLVFVVKIEGAANGIEFQPTIKVWLNGNSSEDTKTVIPEKTIISAAPRYNIQLVRNTSWDQRVTVDFGNGNETGRMYSYGFTIQLYNDNVSKGLKGIEFPKDDITFDIKLKMEKSNNNSTQVEDITNDSDIRLWNYKVNLQDNEGKIPGRQMLFNGIPHSGFCYWIPYGTGTIEQMQNDMNRVYDSGDISMTQIDSSTLRVVINGYKFNGLYPKYKGGNKAGASEFQYDKNVGCFVADEFQIFVPDNKTNLDENGNYYLTVSNENFNAISISGQKIVQQQNLKDDSDTIKHIIHKPGFYGELIWLCDENRITIGSGGQYGDSSAVKGDIITVNSVSQMGTTNEDNVYEVDKLVKFNGEAVEPVKYNGKYFTTTSFDTMTFDIYFVTKKDGKNWSSQEERNNANIEDLKIYENMEDIPEGSLCIGVYYESKDGYCMLPNSSDQRSIYTYLKIKDTAKIGQTYGFVQTSKYWTVDLDRNIYSQIRLNGYENYPEPVYENSGVNYIKTEYDENGEIVPGTHNGSYIGTTILVLGAKQKIQQTPVDINNNEKINYDLGKNENIVRYKIEPSLYQEEENKAEVTGVTIKISDILPSGLTYVPNSSNYGEPDINKNDDGTTTLIWHIYDCISDHLIEPLYFEARISENSLNGIQYTNKAIILSDNDKIGNTELSFRTSTSTIQIINLSSHRLYKTTDMSVVEKGKQIHYTISYKNNTDETISDFQLLDVLPYNGDGRGTEYIGDYILDRIEVMQLDETGKKISNDNLKILYTDDENVRKTVVVSDDDLGEGWKEIKSENVNDKATAIVIKGEIAPQGSLEVNIYLPVSNNSGLNKYVNNATVQVDKATEEMVTSNVNVQVIKRQIEGKVWEDSNENGIKDEEEIAISNIEMILTDELGNQVEDVNGNIISSIRTDENGYYKFENLPMGTYYVKINIPNNEYELTEKEVGTNSEINSKFNKDTQETDVITKLNGTDLPELTVSNVNAGLISRKTSVMVKHVDEKGNNLIEPETIEGKVGDEYQTQAKDFEEYEIKEIIGNETGQMTAEQITVTYVYKKVEGSIEITKVDKKDNSKLIEGATFRVEKLKDNGEVDEEFSYQELTTDKEGKVKFEGLEVGKYRVAETRAPQGYELSKDSIEVEITKENRYITLTAENELKLVLPETGGINNTIIFVIIGFSAMIISLIIAKSEKIKKYYIRHK